MSLTGFRFWLNVVCLADSVVMMTSNLYGISFRSVNVIQICYRILSMNMAGVSYRYRT